VTQLATLTVEADDQVSVARVDGEIDLSNAEPLRQEIVALVPNQALGLVVDFTGVRYLDSSGIRLLFDTARRLEHRQQRMAAVVPVGTPVREILDMAGAEGSLALAETLDEARVLVVKGCRPASCSSEGA
jgi:anti-sigma B factor antagonist